MKIFIDSSVGGGKSVGCWFDDGEMMLRCITLKSKSSTDAELELALFVLKRLGDRYEGREVMIHTDCQRLAQIMTKEYKQTHKKALLYNQLKELITIHGVTIIKVKGHKKRELREFEYESQFNIVDRESRKFLRYLHKESIKST